MKCYETAVPGARVVVDWDGTVTEIDGLHLVLLEFGDEDVYEEHESRLGRDLSLREVIAGEFLTVRAPLDEVVGWMHANARVRAGFASFARRHAPLVVSSGFHELIEPVLEREEVRARMAANHVTADPAGWRTEFTDVPVCHVCGERCKRALVEGLGPFAYVGDGYSDRCVSLAAERRFARAELADWLDEQGVAYERFDDLCDVLAALPTPAR